MNWTETNFGPRPIPLIGAALVACTFAFAAACSSQGETLTASQGGTVSMPSVSVTTPSTPATPSQRVATTPSGLQNPLDGFDLEAPQGFSDAAVPTNKAILVDKTSGEASIALREYWNPDSKTRLTVAVHAPDQADFAQTLSNYGTYEGSVIEDKPNGPYVRTFQLTPREPNATNPPQVVGELADGTHVYVITPNLAVEVMRAILLSVHDAPGSMRRVPVNGGQVVPSGVDG
jgi:hypothetical protein